MPAAEIVGYSLLHYAIVAVPSTGTKASKKAKATAMAKVTESSNLRHVKDAEFSRFEEVSGTRCEVWVVSYVRPSEAPAKAGE